MRFRNSIRRSPTPRRCVFRRPLSGPTDAAWRIAACALGFRIVSAVVALFVLLAFPPDHPLPDQSTMWGRPSPFWDGFVRHDAGWYFGIARTGYDATGAMQGGRSNIAFA